MNLMITEKVYKKIIRDRLTQTIQKKSAEENLRFLRDCLRKIKNQSISKQKETQILLIKLIR